MSVPYLTAVRTYRNGILSTVPLMNCSPDDVTGHYEQGLNVGGRLYAIKSLNYDSAELNNTITQINDDGISKKVMNAWNPMSDDDPSLLPVWYVRWYGTRPGSSGYSSFNYDFTVETDAYKGNEFFHRIKFTPKLNAGIQLIGSARPFSWSDTWSVSSSAPLENEFGPSGTEWGLQLYYTVVINYTPGSQNIDPVWRVQGIVCIRALNAGTDAGTQGTAIISLKTIEVNVAPTDGYLDTSVVGPTFYFLYTDAAFL